MAFLCMADVRFFDWTERVYFLSSNNSRYLYEAIYLLLQIFDDWKTAEFHSVSSIFYYESYLNCVTYFDPLHMINCHAL